MGQFISTGVLKGLLDREDQWAYRIPFAIQWFWPIPLAIITAFAYVRLLLRNCKLHC